MNPVNKQFPVIQLSNWAVVHNSDPYHAPEQHRPHLRGDAKNHPLHPPVTDCSTHPITTSEIVGKTSQGYVITYSGSLYDLMDIDPAYEEKFPNAKEKLINSLPVLDD